MRKVLLLLFSLLVFYACDPSFHKLTLINDTENAVYYRLLIDTVLYPNIQCYLLYPYDTAKPDYVKGGKGAWVYTINKYATDSALHICIFSINQITDGLNSEYLRLTDEMIKNGEYELLSFKVKELDTMNWTVVYRGQNKTKEDAR